MAMMIATSTITTVTATNSSLEPRLSSGNQKWEDLLEEEELLPQDELLSDTVCSGEGAEESCGPWETSSAERWDSAYALGDKVPQLSMPQSNHPLAIMISSLPRIVSKARLMPSAQIAVTAVSCEKKLSLAEGFCGRLATAAELKVLSVGDSSWAC